MQFHIIIPTHERNEILRKTVEFYASLYDSYPLRPVLHVVDSGVVDRETDLAINPNFRTTIIYRHRPGLGLYEKLDEVAREINDEDIVLVSSDDDLYCISPKDVLNFAKSSAYYASPRWLMLKTYSQDRLKLWEAWVHFSKAARVDDPLTRLSLYCGQGLNSFFGLYRGFGLKAKASLERGLYGMFFEKGCWSIVEDYGNIFSLGFPAWEPLVDSWCFRVLDRQYYNNRSWIPSWIALEKLENQYADTLNEANQLLTRALNKSGMSYVSGNFKISELIRMHAQGYQSARSRFWTAGHTFYPDFNLKQNNILFNSSHLDKERVEIILPQKIAYENIFRFYFESEWLSSEFAVSCYNGIPLDYFRIDKKYIAQ